MAASTWNEKGANPVILEIRKTGYWDLKNSRAFIVTGNTEDWWNIPVGDSS